jgi:hypothetical protein
MDYSMLVGLHFRETTPRGNVTPSGRNSGACTPSGFDDGGPRLSGVDVDHLIIDPSRYILNQLILAKLLKVLDNFSFHVLYMNPINQTKNYIFSVIELFHFLDRFSKFSKKNCFVFYVSGGFN